MFTTALLLTVSLSQAGQTPVSRPVDESETASDQPGSAAPTPAWVPKAAPSDEPVWAPSPPQVRSTEPSVVGRSAFTAAGAVAGSGAGLGLVLLFATSNRSMDALFANAMLSAMLATGVGFSVHEAMGGRGEITFALMGALAAMSGAMGLASAIDRSTPAGPAITTLIGTLPAAALVVLALEGSSRGRRPPRVAIGVGPSGAVATVHF